VHAFVDPALLKGLCLGQCILRIQRGVAEEEVELAVMAAEDRVMISI
jgi:hypothetical protein